MISLKIWSLKKNIGIKSSTNINIKNLQFIILLKTFDIAIKKFLLILFILIIILIGASVYLIQKYIFSKIF